MRKRRFFRPLIGVLCVALLILAVAVAVILDSRSPDPILGIFRDDPTEAPTEPASTEEQMTPPDDLPPFVEIPAETDPDTGKVGITFPCEVPAHGLILEKLAPYDGMYVEDGSNQAVQGVAMLLVRNTGDTPLEYTQISVSYGEETLLFDISALPVGEQLVVQEKQKKPVPEGTPTAANALVVHRAKMDMSSEQVRVTDNGNNTLTIENLTDKTIPTVRIFYKYYMEDQDMFIGGIAFTVRVTRLGANGKITLQPSHYTSESARVVMVLTYDSEV